MRTRTLAVLGLIVLLPTIAFAQRGSGGGGGGSKTRGEKDANWDAINGDKGAVKLSKGDVEDISPIKLLIDKRKDLKLSDEQVNGLKNLEKGLNEKTKQSFQAFDSLKKAAQPPLHDPSDDDRAKMMSARRGLGDVVSTIREMYDASAKEALATFDDAQKGKANELLNKQRQDAQDMLKQKLGGGRG